jgi:hypothetical protein
MKVQLWWRGLLIFYLFLILGCTLKAVDTTEIGDNASYDSRVLIATQKSDFKRAVVSDIKEILENKTSYIKVVDVRWLPNESLDDYSAIVVINRCLAGRPDPRVEAFIDNVQEKNKVILLTTGHLDSWKPESSVVDAMTSASTISESNAVARTIAAKVLAVINSQKNI